MGAGQSLALPTIKEDDLDASIKVVEIIDKLDAAQKDAIEKGKPPLPFWNAYQNWLHGLKLYFQLLDSSKKNKNTKNIQKTFDDAKKFIRDTTTPLLEIEKHNKELYKSLSNYNFFLQLPTTLKTFRQYFMQKAGILNMPLPPKEPEWVKLKARLDALRQSGGRRRKTRKASRRRRTRRRS